MTKLPRFLAIAALAVAASSPAVAQQVNDAITLYDQPQQQDFFFQSQRGGLVPDVSATGSIIAAPAATAPFYSHHEYVRKNAEDHR